MIDKMDRLTALPYGIEGRSKVSFDETVTALRDAFKAEGFGQLTEIDVQATLKQKLGAEMGRYLILGMCNPKLAHEALTRETPIGMLLPCNAIVRETEAGVSFGIQDPEAMVMFSGNASLKPIAEEAAARVKAVVGHLEAIRG